MAGSFSVKDGKRLAGQTEPARNLARTMTLALLGGALLTLPPGAVASGTCEAPMDYFGHGAYGTGLETFTIADKLLVDRVVAGETDWWIIPSLWTDYYPSVELVAHNGPLTLEVWETTVPEPCTGRTCIATTTTADPAVRCPIDSWNRTIGVTNSSPLGIEVHYTLHLVAIAEAACPEDPESLDIVCIRAPLIAKVATVTGFEPTDPLVSGPSKTVRAEIGRLRVEASGTFVEQAVAFVQYEGAPPSSVFNQELGPVITSYAPQDEVISLTINTFEPGSPPTSFDIGALWTARLQVYHQGILITDVPFVTFVPS